MITETKLQSQEWESISLQIWRCLGLNTFIQTVFVWVAAPPTISTPLPIIHIPKSARFLLDLEYWHFCQGKESMVKPISLSFSIWDFSEFHGPALKIFVSYDGLHFIFPNLQMRSKTGQVLITTTTKYPKEKNLFCSFNP